MKTMYHSVPFDKGNELSHLRNFLAKQFKEINKLRNDRNGVICFEFSLGVVNGYSLNKQTRSCRQYK